jgi:hypothetical protein
MVLVSLGEALLDKRKTGAALDNQVRLQFKTFALLNLELNKQENLSSKSSLHMTKKHRDINYFILTQSKALHILHNDLLHVMFPKYRSK